MHIKRFEAPTVLEAVQRVKEELGPDALVLSQRTLRKGSGPFGLLGRSVVEITAAVDREAQRASDPRRSARTDAHADGSWRELRATKALVDPLETELRELRRAVEKLSLPSPEVELLSRDLVKLRHETSNLARCFGNDGEQTAAARLAGRLLEAGLAARHAHAIGDRAARSGASGDVQANEALREVLVRKLDSRFLAPRSDDVDPVTLFVGPTGVGKTTTLAKLAARDSGERGLSVITTDTFRLGAEEQLRTFAGLLQVPFGVAVSGEDLARRVSELSGRRVLVDTAGRSRRDTDSFAELCRMREKIGERARVHLVLSATTKESDLAAEVARYRPLAPDSLIITKLDESEDLGCVANLALESDVPPVAWLTNGQHVPEDLLVPDPNEVADQILGRMA